MRKTIIEWLNLLDEPYKSQAIANAIVQRAEGREQYGTGVANEQDAMANAAPSLTGQ